MSLAVDLIAGVSTFGSASTGGNPHRYYLLRKQAPYRTILEGNVPADISSTQSPAPSTYQQEQGNTNSPTTASATGTTIATASETTTGSGSTASSNYVLVPAALMQQPGYIGLEIMRYEPPAGVDVHRRA